MSVIATVPEKPLTLVKKMVRSTIHPCWKVTEESYGETVKSGVSPWTDGA